VSVFDTGGSLIPTILILELRKNAKEGQKFGRVAPPQGWDSDYVSEGMVFRLVDGRETYEVVWPEVVYRPPLEKLKKW
jgi:hypothetical protein